MNNDNSTNNNSVGGIYAKKISQLTSLPRDFYPTEDNPNESKLKSLYFVLGFNGNDEKVANYKMNFNELIDLLISTGRLSATSNTHTISYNFEHITTTAESEFSGNTFELTLIPDLGYDLPEEITVAGSGGYTYNKNTGYLYIITAKKINFITITASAVPIEYTFAINSSGITCENQANLINRVYHIGDTINLNIATNDSYNYDAPTREQIGLEGLNILTYEKYDDKASMSLEINGYNRYTTLTVNAQRINNYYFGYSVKNDTILNYNEDGLPYEAGDNFANMLMRGRNICPIPFIDGFDYGNGDDRIADNDNVFIIVPQKYYNIDKNLYIDDNLNAYKLQSGTFAIEIPVQTEKNNIATPMIYNFIYNDVAYYALCISDDGKQEHQSFIPFGSIKEYVYKIEWHTQLDDSTVIEGKTFSSENDTITIYRLNGTQQTLSIGFTIEIEPKDGVILGSYENGIYTAPTNIVDTTYVTFICKYISNGEEFKSYATMTILKGGTDEDLCGIEWRLNIQQINSLDSFAIMPNFIFGKYGTEDNYEYSNIEQPELLTFRIENGVGELNGSDSAQYNTGLQYVAPKTKDSIVARIKVLYKGYEDVKSITINGLGFDSLYWATDLPKAIYGGLEGEQLDIDTTLYKIIGTTNATMELIEDENNISLVSSMERLSNKIFIPNEVNSDTEVRFTIGYNGFTIDKFVTVKPSPFNLNIIGTYWYIGQYEPTGYTNPENDLIDPLDPNDKTGWREIPNSFSSYKTNPLYSCPANEADRISFHDDAIYYVVIPSGFLFKDILGEPVLIDLYNTITIGNRQYDVYKFDTSIEDYDETFIYNIYYTNASPYYIYWGSSLPSLNTDPENNLSQPVDDSGYIYYTPGWYSLGLSIDNYTQNNPYESPEFSIYDNMLNQISDQCNYLLIPKNIIMTDGGGVPYIDNSGNPTDTSNTAIRKYGELQIQGKDYNVYTNLINAQLSEGIQIKLYSI